MFDPSSPAPLSKIVQRKERLHPKIIEAFSGGTYNAEESAVETELPDIARVSGDEASSVHVRSHDPGTRRKKQGFLNRTFDGKGIRHSHHLRGCKRQRTIDGRSRDLNPLPSQTSRIELRGRYTVPVPAELFKIQRLPISDPAKDLLYDFLRRKAFWEGVKNHRVPVEFAGLTYLNVKLRQTQKRLAELEDAGGPLRWFQHKAFEGFRAGKIAQGKATAWCPIADLFFASLVGGEERMKEIRARSPGKIDTWSKKESETTAALEREALEYTICKYLTDSTATRKGR
jgi:hypothetical protein